jgi:hypothetical protein
MLNTNTVNVAPLKVDFKETTTRINANERMVDSAILYLNQTTEVVQDIYKNTATENK